MKKIFLVLFVCLLTTVVNGTQVPDSVDLKTAVQDTFLNYTEDYVLLLRTDSIIPEVFKQKETCIIDQAYHQSKSYYLVKISIVKVVYLADTSVYNSPKELLSVKYLLVPKKKILSFFKGRRLMVSACNSSTKKYLGFVKIRNDVIGCEYRPNYPYAGGLCTCYKKVFLRKKNSKKKYEQKNIRIDKAAVFVDKNP